VSDWILPNLRYSLNGGIDSWDTGTTAASFGGTLERRLFADRLAVEGDATTWVPLGKDDFKVGFNALGARAQARTRSPRDWGYDIGAGATWVSDAAPFSIWSGAGEGRARPNLLRAHPLLDNGVIDARGGATFGRTLRYGNAEGQRWLSRPSLVRIGIAAFVDMAQATRRLATADGPVQTDIGGGLRFRIPGAQGMLRVDVAHGLRDGANAVTIGWMVK
jgi:hypothetical protein